MVLYGWQRKVALLPLSLLVLGWVIFSVGFIWKLTEIPGNRGATYNTSRSNPLLYSHYVLLIGGPFVYILGVAQAIWPGTASAVLGIPTAFVSTVYLVAAGARSYDEAIYIRNLSNQSSDVGTLSTDTSQRVAMFVGAAFITVCWCFVLMLSVCYKSRTRTDHGHYELFDQPANRRSRISKKCPFTPGVARGLSIPFLILSAVGWCVFVAGIQRTKTSFFPDEQAYQLGNYGAIVVGPLLFLAALLHAGCSGEASTVMGVFASLLSSVYVVFMGSMVTVIGKAFYSKCQNPEVNKLDCSFLHSSVDINWIYTFSGGVGSLFFWTCVLALRPFYRNRSQEDQGSNVINATNPHYGTMRLEESYSNGDTHSPL